MNLKALKIKEKMVKSLFAFNNHRSKMRLVHQLNGTRLDIVNSLKLGLINDADYKELTSLLNEGTVLAKNLRRARCWE